MERLFAVIRTRGPRWKASRPLEMQAGWQPHADFMDRLAAEGFVVLGGPLAGTRNVLLIVGARDAKAVRARLARDPWSRQGLLRVKSVTPWTLRLGAVSQKPAKAKA